MVLKKGAVFHMEIDNNYANGYGIPMGLGMALAKDINAMNYFSSLDREHQQEVINHTHEIRSKREMQQFVSHIADNNSFR